MEIAATGRPAHGKDKSSGSLLGSGADRTTANASIVILGDRQVTLHYPNDTVLLRDDSLARTCYDKLRYDHR
jgi:hypothetical protein